MITVDQGIVHLVGDFLTQSDWMAQNKTKAHFPAFCHALVYSLGFLVFTPSPKAWLVIFVTHFLIDRYRLARYVVWAKNFIAPKTWWKHMRSGEFVPCSNQDAMIFRVWIKHESDITMPACCEGVLTVWHCRMLPFKECSSTGYAPSTPAWLAVWLMIAADNTLHVIINGLALKYL